MFCLGSFTEQKAHGHYLKDRYLGMSSGLNLEALGSLMAEEVQTL